MTPLLAALLAVSSPITDRKEYLELLKTAPTLFDPIGNAAKGEIEILLDPRKMGAIERKTGRKVGIVARDAYWTWVNDAVKFPSGIEGVYGRIFYTKTKGDPRAGVAVMSFLPNGNVVLNCNYRHATRSWEIELPRGGREGQSVEDAARREVLEETGMSIDSLVLLGEMASDTGIYSTVIPIYKAKVSKRDKPTPAASEAIEEILSLSIDEIKEAFLNGFWEMEIRGEKQKVPFRDSFLAFALMQHLLGK